MKNEIIGYDEFTFILKNRIYRNSKADLINKVAMYPDRYVGIFRPTSPKIKLIQNITQSHEISFGDFIEDIITIYLGKYYINLPKRAKYNDEEIMFDQLFEYDNRIFMLEQKMRDDHDSTKKRGQYENFLKKIDFLKLKYPNKKIIAGMWFVDDSLKKNRNYYKSQMILTKEENVETHLFYGEEFANFLDNIKIWNEMEEYLMKWKTSEDNNIELNFEIDWQNTKQELLMHVPKRNWIKIKNNRQIVEEILPILFPTKKYKEILKELEID